MKNKKSVVASIVLSGALVVVGTLAYFTQTHTVDNKLKTKGFGSDIVEKFTPKEFNPGATVTKEVRVDNTGDYALVARAKWEESWTRNGEEFKAVAYPDTNNESVVDKNGMSDKWVDGNDGWAYYNEMIGVNGHTENFLTSITLKNSADVVGTDKTSIGTDSKTQWVKISEEEFKALDDENNNIKATFKRAEVKSNGLYDNAEYTLTITAQVSQANKEAAATWITDATNQTVKNFLNGLPTVNN